MTTSKSSAPSRTFRVEDVLTVVTGRFVSRNLDATYNILRFLTGDEDLFNHDLARALQICRPHIRTKMQVLSEQSTALDIAQLDEWLRDAKVTRLPDAPRKAMETWWQDMAQKYGPTFEVTPLPAGTWEKRGPVGELLRLGLPAESLILVETPTDRQAV